MAEGQCDDVFYGNFSNEEKMRKRIQCNWARYAINWVNAHNRGAGFPNLIDNDTKFTQIAYQITLPSHGNDNFLVSLRDSGSLGLSDSAISAFNEYFSKPAATLDYAKAITSAKADCCFSLEGRRLATSCDWSSNGCSCSSAYNANCPMPEGVWDATVE
ncbi:MAG: hypothetical protein S4CHLAM102_14440 [Chlamydiia bacterium]|nr:hypothetical protein [Chlamydiia bacterium]